MTRVEMAGERALQYEVTVNASQEVVWEAWTTAAGIESFFAPAASVELEPGGAYEMYFDPNGEAGKRGGEGNVVLAVQPESFLSFSWNAPPSIPAVRDQRTVVLLRLSRIDGERTAVTLTHVGWGAGDAWDAAFEYFEEAWGDAVLPNLQRRFEDGPIDWPGDGS